jgi:hypothetical protein
MTSLLIFGANVLTDILAVLFIQEVTKGHRTRAALVSMAIVALSYFSIIYIVADGWFALPAILGAGLGTFWTVKRR